MLREMLDRYREMAPDLGLSIEELMNPLLDRVVEEGPRIRYAIYSPQRSGSHLLCQYLFRMRTGIPLEYFNWRIIREMSPRLGCDLHHADYRERRKERRGDRELDRALVERETRYLRALVRQRSWNGGAFGFKIQAPQGSLVKGLVLRAFDEHPYRFLLLRRRDVIAGAASLHFSLATGMWTTDQVSHSRQIPVKALLDPVKIMESYDALKDQDGRIPIFAERYGERCLLLHTEDLIRSPTDVLNRVLEHLGEAPRAVPVIPPPGSGFEGWRREMLAEIRKVLEAGLAQRSPAPSK